MTKRNPVWLRLVTTKAGWHEEDQSLIPNS